MLGNTRSGPRIGYYLGSYPILTETFVMREIQGLRKLGVDIHVIAAQRAEYASSYETLNVEASSAQYLLPTGVFAIVEALVWALLLSPSRLIAVLIDIVVTDYDERKSVFFDAKLSGLVIVLAHRMKQLDVQQIHCPWAHTAATVALSAGRLLNVPVSLQARAYELHRASCTDATIERLHRAHTVITNSKFNHRFISSRLGEPEATKVHWLYNSVPLSELAPPPCREDSGSINILSVGRLIEKKGFPTLISSLASLQKEHKLSCRIVGGEDPHSQGYRGTLEAQVQSAGLGGCVEFLGPRPFEAVVAQYRWADVFVLTSCVPPNGDIDVTPNVIMEAMAMGVPVITTPVGAIPELIEDGVSGILVPEGDVTALTSTLSALLGDRQRMNKMGLSARRRAEDLFDPASNIRVLKEFLSSD